MSKKMITLISSDNKSFQIEESAAKLSIIIRNIIEEDVTVIGAIPLPIVDGATLSKIVGYCNKHAKKSRKTKADKDEEDDLSEWDKQFLGTDYNDLFSILRATNYLKIECLFDTASKIFADLISDKSVQEFREIFKIENDYTSEEEAELRKENAWAFK